MELRHYLRVLLRRWPVIVATFVVAVIVAVAVSSKATTSYAGRSTVLLGPGSYAFSGSDANLPTPDEVLGLTSLMQTYAALVPSLPVVAAAVSASGIPRSPGQVAAETQASTVQGTQILTITVTDPVPSVAARLATAVANAFVARYGHPTATTGGPVSGAASGSASGSASGPATDSAISMSVLSPAYGASPVTTGGRRRNVELGALIGVLVALVLAALAEYLDQTVRDGDDLERKLALPLLGVLPAGPTPAAPGPGLGRADATGALRGDPAGRR